jgi:hypothetical protein
VADADALETIAAINRLIIPWQEWNLILFSTFGAGNRVHLTGPAISPVGRHRLLATLTTIQASPWFVEQPLLLVELLLACGEDEVLPALSTL